MTHQVVAVEIPYEGRLFDVHVVRVRTADGGEMKREIVRHPGAVLVLPVLDDGRIVLIRNFRIAPDQRLWELPAGKLEPDEEPAAAAARELEEETGYRAGTIRPLGEYYTSPGFTDELMHAFVAEDLEFIGQRLEAGEDIEAVAVDVDEALAMALDGRIRDGKTIAALLMWDRLSAFGSRRSACCALHDPTADNREPKADSRQPRADPT